MRTLHVRIETMDAMRAGFLDAWENAAAGKPRTADHGVSFASYDDMHRVLAPSRLAIVKIMAGQGPLAIREVARRVGRDVQAVHRDITTLINAGIIDREEGGVVFPYDEIDFAFKVSAAA
ncbi:DeoR family transcriptional regulator [Prosthecomicrobium pneumaticum]|nr:DeoR family transcriptional regulator [Prosthecomicrobium pneumaticum]